MQKHADRVAPDEILKTEKNTAENRLFSAIFLLRREVYLGELLAYMRIQITWKKAEILFQFI